MVGTGVGVAVDAVVGSSVGVAVGAAVCTVVGATVGDIVASHSCLNDASKSDVL
jgi:hypothetical protein